VGTVQSQVIALIIPLDLMIMIVLSLDKNIFKQVTRELDWTLLGVVGLKEVLILEASQVLLWKAENVC
jgi:hypothetical protein